MGNKGSIVVEMCLLTPILVCMMFVIINMLILAMNYSMSTGEAYTILYSRKEYMLDGDKDRVSDEVDSINGDMKADIQEMLIYSENICADSKFTADGTEGFGLLTGAVSGEFMASVSYDQMVPGMFVFDGGGRLTKSAEARQEVRNVGSNLRRWQIYGELLSDRGN